MNAEFLVRLRLSNLSQARELADYQGEPAQMAAGAPGKLGYLKLGFEKRGERSVLAHLHRIAPLLVQQALYWDEAMPELPICMISSLGGGVLQGDRLTIEIDVGDDAIGHVTTQGATRIHEMDANHAILLQTLRLGERAYFEYIPEVAIPYKNARYLSHTRIILAPSATLVFADSLMPGRKHRGEKFAYDVVSLTTEAERPDGALLFSEKLLIEPAVSRPQSCGALGGFDVFGSLLILTPPETAARILSRIGADFAKNATIASAISVLPEQAGLIFRAVAQESHQVRARLRACWRIVREEATGKTLPEEFLWR